MTDVIETPSRLRRYRAPLLAALAIAVSAALVIALVTRKRAPEKAPPIQARLELAAGEVRIDSGQGEVRAISGTALLSDAKVRTAKGARALIRMPDGSVVFMRGDSALELHEASVGLERGEYWLDAPPTERTPLVHQLGDVTVSAADAGLSIRRQGETRVVYVARGMATLSSKGGRVEVNAGEQASVSGGEAPRVAPLAFWDDWTGGMADAKAGSLLGAGAGTIYGVDEGAPAGSVSRRLEISKQAVHAVVREGLSETEVDQTFFNPSERPVEGWYWFTVPERASITGFAVETDGILVDGEFTESKEAKAQYAAAKQGGYSPAILEWVDNRTVRARIYPVPAGGQRRVVLRYIELRPQSGKKIEYVYPLGAGDPVRIGEFSLSVDLGDAGTKMKIATLADARIEQGGKLLTMRRSGYTPRAPFQLEATLPDERPALSVSRFSAGGDSADYVMARYRPDIEWSKVAEQRAEVVVVVDTSAAGDESSRQLKVATAEAILRALSDDDRFALIALDVSPRALHPNVGLAPASEKEISRALEALADHASGGATDLSAMFDMALGRLHAAEQPAVVYVGDGIATSGEMTAEQLIERMRRAFTTSRARLFTVAAGVEADHALLAELARAGGGESLRVDDTEETTARALELASAIKVPTITDLDIDLGAGLDEPFVSASGKVSRGSEVVILARTHHDLPSKITVRGRVSGSPFQKQYAVDRDPSVLAQFVPRLWAAEYVRRLLGGAEGPDAERGRIVALGIEYGLLTPFTSILALENEAAYARMGIQRRRDTKLRGVRLSALTPDEERRAAARASEWSVAPAIALGCNKSESAPAANRSEEQTQTVAAAPGAPPIVQATPTAAPEPQKDQPVEESERMAKSESAPAAAPTPKPATGDPLAAPDDAKELDALQGRRGGGGPAGIAAGGEGLGSLGGRAKGAAAAPLPHRAKLAESRGYGSDGVNRDEKQTEVFSLGVCSDAAGRPLAQRLLLWRKRLRAAGSPSELVARYDAARRACELPDWRAERAFLELLERRIDSPGAAELVLGHFNGRADVQKFLAKLILRRAVDSAMVSAVERILFGGFVDWNDVDLKLQAIKSVDERIAKLREFLARAPDDPSGGMRLVRLLVEANRRDEALAVGRRLRDQGFVTPRIAEELGDVLARAGLDAEAVRTYSEIVEFDPEGIASRRLLGDIYLGHGWYEPAYSQYRTLTEAAPADALGFLRLAAAAAGTGRIDEALRLERHVASAQGTPGPSDPRRWARLLSAARLARLIANPPPAVPGDTTDPGRRTDGMKRELKELQLFSGPGVLELVTWEQLDADVQLTLRADGEDAALGEPTDAARSGLFAVLLSSADAARTSSVARLRSVPRTADLPLVFHQIAWNGKDFAIKIEQRALPLRQTQVAL